jgi:uncharacterized OB-fold protein
MSGENDAARLSLTLTWQHGLGSLTAFFAGLERGVIIGSRCLGCGHSAVPPRDRCPHDGAAMQQVELPPVGVVFGVTTGPASRLLGSDGAEHTFAQVQIHGCDNRILDRIDPAGGPVLPGSTVRLVQSCVRSIHPAQNLLFVADQSVLPDPVVDP